MIEKEDKAMSKKSKVVSVEITAAERKALKKAGAALSECAGAYITATDNTKKR